MGVLGNDRAPIAFALAVAAVLLSGPRPAAAAIPSRTETGQLISWPGRRVTLVPDAELVPGLDGVGVRAAMAAAAASWEVAGSCTDIRLQITEPRAGLSVGYDATQGATNLIRTVIESWPHEPSAVALTTVTFAEGSGGALDADIELNAAVHRFTLDPVDGESGGLRDLQSVLTHELGHVLGLEHPCDEGTRPGPVTDVFGDPAPRCCPNGGTCSVAAARENLKDRPDINGATMFSFSEPGESGIRSPEADDILGVCTLYPLVRVTPPAPRPLAPRDAGCQMIGAVGVPASSSAPALPTAALLWLLLARSRPAGSAPPSRAHQPRARPRRC